MMVKAITVIGPNLGQKRLPCDTDLASIRLRLVNRLLIAAIKSIAAAKLIMPPREPDTIVAVPISAAAKP
jgi:hypothetical protein